VIPARPSRFKRRYWEAGSLFEGDTVNLTGFKGDTGSSRSLTRLKRRHWKPRSQGLKKEILEAKVPQGLKGDTGSLLSLKAQRRQS
jgi:hypothetical protein